MLKKRGNLFKGIQESMPEEIFDTLVDSRHLKLKRIISQGQITPLGQWLEQERDEWVVLLTGSARLLFEGEELAVELNPGDYVHITAHCRHRVEWTDSEQKTVWLALHYVNNKEIDYR